MIRLTRYKRSLLAVVAGLWFCFGAAAQDAPFFDTSRSDKLLSVGLRMGLNSSGVHTNYLDVQSEVVQNNFYWRMGGQIGAVVDLHIRRFFGIEVGLFSENRSYDCALMGANIQDDYMGSRFVHSRFTYLSVPVSLSFKCNILKGAVMQFDIGSYWAYGIAGKKRMDSYISFGGEGGQLVFDRSSTKDNYFGADPKDFLAVNRTDVGVRIGTGLTFFDHYFIGLYYQNSIRNNAKNREGSPHYKIRNRGWDISLGYNF